MRIPRGSVLYHGTHRGNAFKFPEGPAWFTPEREVAEHYMGKNWDAGDEAYTSNPRRLKYRTKKDLVFPSIKHTGDPLHAMLATYAAKAGLGTQADLELAIGYLGTASRHSWWPFDEEDRKEIEEGRRGQTWTPEKMAVHDGLASRFKNVSEFMLFLCAKTGFIGWAVGNEVALCQPRKYLKQVARQKPKTRKLTVREKREVIEKAIKDNASAARRRTKEVQKERAKTRKEEVENQVWNHLHGFTEGVDYKDPEVKAALRNWEEWVKPSFLGFGLGKTWDEVASWGRVAARYREAAITFRDERSPRVDYARRFSLCDSKADPPAKREYLFTDEYRRWSDRTHKRLKKPVLESRGVTDPCDIAYIDYGGGGKDLHIHLVITRSDQRGKGLATRLLQEFYKKKVPKGAAVRWGRIMNQTSMALFKKMKKMRPDVVHMGGKFY